ncbi:MAG: GntR family transcriptional regulator [Cellvibrionaceae bacterium]|nr:GntR family transcriptional regulator [Cellvibrionaceae bacterium]
MFTINQLHSLVITEVSPRGIYVDGREYGKVRLREARQQLQRGDKVTAFIYRDSADRVTATMAKPKITPGRCAYLQVVDKGDRGAFLDWGMPKDLLLPYNEQASPVTQGNAYVVYAYADEKQRMVASTRLHHHLDEHYGNLRVGDRVDLLIASRTELGFKAVINNHQLGLIYHNELSQPLQFGTRMPGRVKAIREDGKIDLNINLLDKHSRDALENCILQHLEDAGGRMALSDKSPPEAIFRIFSVSKKNFKRALGSLYKQRLIKITPEYIERV